MKVGIGTVLGGDPQDLKFKGEHTTVEIGDGTTIREYTTINRGTTQSYKTTVGKDCFIMSYVHLAHDCHVGDGVILVEQRAARGARHGRRQGDHRRAERGAPVREDRPATRFVGGCSRISQDVPPYIKAVGNPIKLYGLNSVGLQRNNFPEEVVRELKRAYRLFFRSELNVSQAKERARGRAEAVPRGAGAAPLRRGERPRSRRLSARVRIGVIGAGGLGFHHVRILRDLPGSAFAGFYESRPDARRQVAAELGVTAHPTRSRRCSTSSMR